MKASGGYVVTKTPLVRTSFIKHTAALPRPVSDLDIRALNTVQDTPWTVNRWVLDVMQEAFDKGLTIGGVVSGEPPGVPDRLPDDTWAAMTDEQKAPHLDARRKAHAARASFVGQQGAFLDRLMIAQRLRDEPAIWFPHTKDFRGRIYPLPVAGPHPQGDDVAKALLMFAEGLPLGDDGEFWLLVRAANCFGKDKLTLEERVGWTLEHSPQIKQSSSDPTGSTWWLQAEEPWSFLATCAELTMMWSHSDPSAFISHLPIPMDGSCNGLQHLSAMGLDPIGALATNLCPGPRQDIYMEVARHVQARVERDAQDGLPAAQGWLGKVSRSVCKRAVMTTPYGVTDGGIRTQLLNDGHIPADAEDKGEAATYLKGCLVEALEATIQAGRAIMGWLQDTAEALANAGLPFDWQTPTGSWCRQAYYENSRSVVATLCGRLVLMAENENATLKARKQALGAAPNFVHSFDASHLALTVLEAADDGIRHFAMIHDSFATHAGRTTLLARILRETFVDIYRTDWLQKTYDAVREYAPHVSIPETPARGDLDIACVLDSVFFFS